MSYTKGPWVAKAVDHDDGRGVLFWDIDVPQVDGGYRGDAATVHHSEHINGVTKDEAEANAHLIAAAPDMYEALKAMVDELNAFVVTSGIDTKDPKHKNGTWYVRREAAKAAISKAEGE